MAAGHVSRNYEVADGPSKEADASKIAVASHTKACIHEAEVVAADDNNFNDIRNEDSNCSNNTTY